jgi:hypothetical protein
VRRQRCEPVKSSTAQDAEDFNSPLQGFLPVCGRTYSIPSLAYETTCSQRTYIPVKVVNHNVGQFRRESAIVARHGQALNPLSPVPMNRESQLAIEDRAYIFM